MKTKNWDSLDKKSLPEKSGTRVSINAFMMANLFFILTLIWTLSPDKFSKFIIYQLVLGIPLLFISSLAYAKLGYWKDILAWDRFAWTTNTLGNIFVLNIIGLIAATFDRTLAFVYFGVVVFLIAFYYGINITLAPHTTRARIRKFLFFIIILVLGGILPLL
jgi:hypothetical protein